MWWYCPRRLGAEWSRVTVKHSCDFLQKCRHPLLTISSSAPATLVTANLRRSGKPSSDWNQYDLAAYHHCCSPKESRIFCHFHGHQTSGECVKRGGEEVVAFPGSGTESYVHGVSDYCSGHCYLRCKQQTSARYPPQCTLLGLFPPSISPPPL